MCSNTKLTTIRRTKSSRFAPLTQQEQSSQCVQIQNASCKATHALLTHIRKLLTTLPKQAKARKSGTFSYQAMEHLRWATTPKLGRSPPDISQFASLFMVTQNERNHTGAVDQLIAQTPTTINTTRQQRNRRKHNGAVDQWIAQTPSTIKISH